ncbi:hybrid sensor histidine kinase/response regulator [Anabaenopsis elenkinii]|uniref:histidine kinase n=1 Tax=Anabaenopsis elenkinii CCIBt3563 TaxID=2779889 RepID=A0A7S6RBQ8_9CYAN|nr:PAS domain-containing sensor histidine kinase [Anabaenopsis elenkinii]QOV22013.1 PAS domain S-box protein [Anabaenopsis elenkinii CCIBt3563]
MISFVQVPLPNVQKVNQPPEIMRCQTDNHVTKWSDLQTAEVMEGNQELRQTIEELQVLIQELRQQNQEMRIALEITQLERQHYKYLFDCAPHAYLVTDIAGVIQEANHAAATLLCVEQNYLMGKPLVLFVIEQDRDSFITQLQSVQHKKNWEICLQPQGGVSLPATVRYTAISNPQSNPVDWRWLLFEISPQAALYSQEGKDLGDGVVELNKQLLPFNQVLQQEITQRQQAQESLRQKEKLYRQLVETQTDLIIRIDLQGRVGFANKVTCQALGKQLHELIGKSICEFFHTHDFPQIKEDISSLISAPHDKITNEYRLLTVNGVRWLEWNITPIVNERGDVLEFQGVGRDITQRKRGEEKIREQAALLDIATDAILVLDLQGKILFCNQGAEQIYSWQTQEVLGKDLRDLFNNINLLQLETSLAAVIASGSWQGELSKVTKSGQEIVVASRWRLMYDPAGEPKSILVVETDITQKKQLEEKFFRAQRLESLGTLASGISHDLNNILTPILAASQLLQVRYAQDKENYQQLLAIIESNSKRGAALVKQVLSFARGFKGERTIVQLRHLISEVTYIAKQTFPKSIQFAITISEDMWAVCADATQLHQVLMNLVVNARDAMPAGGTLTISTKNMFIDQAYAHMNLDAKVGDYVVVTVADSGTGIAPEILQRIFDPFFTTKDIGKGTGLGLSTVLGIIKNHGGFINVSSTVGQGTEFHLFLPAVEVPQSLDINNNLDIFPGQGELILFVDDEAQIREIAKIVLEKYNYRILAASNGIEAIALYAQYSQDIRAVFMDIMMPEMDGNTAIRTLQKINPKVKIIACSGTNPTVPLANDAGHTDADLVVYKPYTARDLLNSLHHVLQKIG